MSVISNTEKDALVHPVIKQPFMIHKGMMILFSFIIIIAILCSQTLIAQQDFSIQISPENYQSITMSEPVFIKQQLLKNGQPVNKNQNVYLVSMTQNKNAKQQHVRAADPGLFFHANTNNSDTIIQPYDAIGYILKNNPHNELAFWLQDKPDTPIRVGDEVKIQIEQHYIVGKVSMLVGAFSNKKGQKVYIKFNSSQQFFSLSPESVITLSRVELS